MAHCALPRGDAAAAVLPKPNIFRDLMVTYCLRRPLSGVLAANMPRSARHRASASQELRR
jgi:hypothetical protein